MLHGDLQNCALPCFMPAAQEELPLYAFLWALLPEWLQQNVHLTALLSLTAELTEAEYAEAILTDKS